MAQWVKDDGNKLQGRQTSRPFVHVVQNGQWRRKVNLGRQEGWGLEALVRERAAERSTILPGIYGVPLYGNRWRNMFHDRCEGWQRDDREIHG